MIAEISLTDLKALVRGNGRKDVSVGDPNFLRAIFLNQAADDLVAPYRQHEWTYVCVDILQKNFSGVPLVVKTGDRQKSDLVESGPFYELFRGVNPFMSQAQALTAWSIHMKLFGESIWVLTDPAGKPIARETQVPERLWPLPGSLFADERNAERTQIVRWKLNHGGKEVAFEPFQVLHFAYYNPYDPPRGLAPLQAAMAAVRQDYKAGRWNEAVLDNDGVPAGFFETDYDIDPTARKEIEERHQDEHGGYDKKGKMKVLVRMKFNPAGGTHKDMEFAALKKWNRDAVFAIFRVPPFEAGLTEDVNRATATASKAKLFEGAIIPDQKLFSDVVNLRMEPWTGEKAWVEFDNSQVEALKEGMTEKIEQGEKLRDLGWPVADVNERLDLGMPELPDGLGKVPIVPLSLQRLEDVADPLPEAPEEDEGPPPTNTPPGAPPQGDEEGQAQEDAERGAPAIHVVKGRERWDRFEAKLFRPAERKWMALLRVHIRRDRDETLRRLRAADRGTLRGLRATVERLPVLWADADGVLRGTDGEPLVKDVDFGDIESILFDLERSNVRLSQTTRPLYRRVMLEGLQSAATELGGLEVIDPHYAPLVRFLEQKTLKIRRVNVTTRERIRVQLIRGLRAGEDLRGLTKRLNGAFSRTASAGRRLTIGRTETSSMLNNTRFQAFGVEGVDEHEWITARDEVVRAAHEVLMGVVVAVGTAFPNGLKHPHDPDASADEAVNCRCITGAVV